MPTPACCSSRAPCPARRVAWCWSRRLRRAVRDEMASVRIQKPDGGSEGSVELPVEVFDVAENKPLMHQVVVAQLAAARQGTHKTKTRAEVRGGGAKPYRQKGTGRARQGSGG